MQRKEPTLDGSAALEPQLDRPIGRNPGMAAAPAEEGSGGFSVLALFALILALAGLGAAGFLYQQWQESRAQLVDAENRIVELEKRFEMSDEESTASVEVLSARAKENASEIRKLWGVSYDTNRKSIADNKKQLASLSGKVNGLSGSVKKIAAVESALAELRESNTENRREVTDKLAGLERQLNSVRSDLTARVGANEEGIQSIDAYRRSVNKDLVQLRDAIRNLQSDSSTAASSL